MQVRDLAYLVACELNAEHLALLDGAMNETELETPFNKCHVFESGVALRVSHLKDWPVPNTSLKVLQPREPPASSPQQAPWSASYLNQCKSPAGTGFEKNCSSCALFSKPL